MTNVIFINIKQRERERALYINDYDFRNRNIYLMTSLIIVHPPTCQMPEKIRFEKKQKERKEKKRDKTRITEWWKRRATTRERERESKAHKAIVRTLFSHAHARVESKARPISYGDSLTSRVHHRTCLYRRYWQPSFDEARRGGWLGSSAIQGTTCVRVHICTCVCARARARTRLYHRASHPVCPSVCRPDRPIGRTVRPRVNAKKRKKNARKRDARADSGSFVIRSYGRTRDWGSDRSYLRRMEEILCRIMDNGQRAHDTVLTTDSEFISHEKPESPRRVRNRAMIFGF